MNTTATLFIRLTPAALRPQWERQSTNQFNGGPETLLRWLETQLGLPGRRSVNERRNLVTEVIPMEVELEAMTGSVTQLGYNVEVIQVNCDPQVGWQRNVNRSDDNISAVFTESFHERWLIGAQEMLTSAAK